jgi:hypothetical protein
MIFFVFNQPQPTNAQARVQAIKGVGTADTFCRPNGFEVRLYGSTENFETMRARLEQTFGFSATSGGQEFAL